MAGNLVSGPLVAQWVVSKFDGDVGPNAQAIGLERNGSLVAGVVFEGWNHKSLMCHISIDGAVTRDFMKAVCEYAFITCGAHKVIGPITSDNEKAIKNAVRIGFTEEARIKDAAPNGDIILFTLTADRCRYLGVRHGK
jgi:RimJ/RimL family protein N-acetyltransferase